MFEGEEAREYLALKDELASREAGRKFFRLFPDEGPFSRDKYQKQVDFFNLGATKPYRVLSGSNGCISPWTKIETPDGAVPILKYLGDAPFAVQSWDGERRCTAQASRAFLKMLAPCFRVYLDNGQSFDCSHKHRVLTPEGWLAFDQLVQLSSGVRYWRTSQDWKASYAPGDRRGDARPQRARGIDLAPPLSPADAQQQLRFALREGAEERTPEYTHAYQGIVQFPNSAYDLAQVEALCGPLVDPTMQLDALWSVETRQVLQCTAPRYDPSLATALASECLPEHGQSPRTASGVECLFVPNTNGEPGSSCGSVQLYAQQARPGQWPLELLDGDLGEWIWVPSEHTLLCGGNRIVAVVPMGIQPIFDLTVEGTHCYEAAGVFHHNCGKSVAGMYETTCHATGLYPDWWKGKRFTRPIKGWIAGVDFKTIRESLQNTLLGPRGQEGSGLIPKDCIHDQKYKTHPADTLDFVEIKHVSGGVSRLVIKSYEEGREAFQAATLDWIALDEEPPDYGIYSECIQRFRGESADGQIILTFTPLLGISEIVASFIPAFIQNYDEAAHERSGRGHINCDIIDVPHISEEEIARKTENMLPHERSARLHGIPSVGIGLVYPFAEEVFKMKPEPVPAHWKRIFGLDIGKKMTAAVWLAVDTETGIHWAYSEHFLGDTLPPIHIQAIRARGHWIPGVIDTSSRQSERLSEEVPWDVYADKKSGLLVRKADNTAGSVGRGILAVTTLLAEGRLKIFSTCTNLLREIRQYSYGENGLIKKQDDHGLDALRYAIIAAPTQARLPRGPEDWGGARGRVQEETFGIWG